MRRNKKTRMEERLLRRLGIKSRRHTENKGRMQCKLGLTEILIKKLEKELVVNNQKKEE